MPEPSARRLPVTVAVPVRNDAVNLARCLERLYRFADVVVIDSGSTDGTLDVARKAGARVIQFAWNGKFPKKRNWFLQNHPPEQAWVLFLDADEYVDDRFCDELERTLPATTMNGFWLNYTSHFLGRQLRNGLEQRKLALFRTGTGLYERIEEDHWSGLDMEVHEHPIVEGAIGEIHAPIDHQDFKGLAKFIDRHRDYASWEARRFVALRADDVAWSHLTRRQAFKYKHITKWWYPLFYFLFTFVIKRGFLDGAAGFHYAFYKAWYFHSIRLLIREVR